MRKISPIFLLLFATVIVPAQKSYRVVTALRLTCSTQSGLTALCDRFSPSNRERRAKTCSSFLRQKAASQAGRSEPMCTNDVHISKWM